MSLVLVEHPTNPKLWESYTDALGQTVKIDDYVAYASISGKSPQLVIARVIEVRRVDSLNDPIFEDWKKTIPGCKVKVMPLINARGFRRYGKKKTVTLSLPQNIIKIKWKPNYKTEKILSQFLEEE